MMPKEMVKIFRYGGNEDDRLTGMLKNMVAAIKHRLLRVDNEDTLREVLESIEALLGQESDEQLWSYLARYIVKPQFMVPRMIPHAMKDERIDEPLTKEALAVAIAADETHKKSMQELGVKFFGKKKPGDHPGTQNELPVTGEKEKTPGFFGKMKKLKKPLVNKKL